MEHATPLSTLLSQTLVALTIELDNEAELQLRHRTTRQGLGNTEPLARLSAPWLVSVAMDFNCVRHIPPGGLPLAELLRRARTETNLPGMKRWGYITLSPDPAAPRPSRLSQIVRLTPAGLAAQQLWQTLIPALEHRWRKRFGPDAIDSLRSALCALVAQLPPTLPDCIPIHGYGLLLKPQPKLPAAKPSVAPSPSSPIAQESESPAQNEDPAAKSPGAPSLRSLTAQGWETPTPTKTSGLSELPLLALLARPLVAFARDFEAASPVSLCLTANVLRLLDTPQRLRDLPRLAGVSKESMAFGTGFLTRHGYATQAPEPPPSRAKRLTLTPEGQRTRAAALALIPTLEDQWQTRFGKETVINLRSALEPLTGDGTPDSSPLFACLHPQPGTWRATCPQPQTLPHFPMILHRGAFPDGS